MRGPLDEMDVDETNQGITPACAGTTSASYFALSSSRDHPRMCGDHLDACCGSRMFWGSPPHVRGPRLWHNIIALALGITPACAGTTYWYSYSALFKRDHPRMCGDHALDGLKEPEGWGSPPHVRGPLTARIEDVLRMGSPPHVRGPHSQHDVVGCFEGITPACAGTTVNGQYIKVVWGDHPRMCGDHYKLEDCDEYIEGSPPHVRGPQP